MSVDNVIESGPLDVIGQFSHDVIGCKTRVKFVNSHWSVLIRLLFVDLFVGLFTSLIYVFFDLSGKVDVGVLFVKSDCEKRQFRLCVRRYMCRQRSVTIAVLFVGKLQGRVPRCFASQFLRQQRRPANP